MNLESILLHLSKEYSVRTKEPNGINGDIMCECSMSQEGIKASYFALHRNMGEIKIAKQVSSNEEGIRKKPKLDLDIDL